MNISAVSSASSGVDGSSTTLGQLEKQKAELVQELQKEQDSKDDAKTKQAKLQQLRAQIAQIEMQINQIKMRQHSHAQKDNQPSASPQTADSNAGSVDTLV